MDLQLSDKVALVTAATLTAAEEPPPAWFVSPPALEPALGEVVLEIEVEHPDVRQVLFLVDGREVEVVQLPDASDTDAYARPPIRSSARVAEAEP